MAALFALLLIAAPPALRHSDEGAPALVKPLLSRDGAASYLLELEDSVVAIDAPSSAADAQAAREQLAAMHKPLLAILLTAPDRAAFFKELAAGQPEAVPTYSSESVRESLRAALGAVQIDRPLQDRQTVELGGARFTAHELGEGRATFVLLGKPPQAFVGDLLVRGAAPELASRKTGRWLEQLELAKRLFYGLRIFHPGHGGEATFAALGEQRAALLKLRETVADVAKGRPKLTDAERAGLLQKLQPLSPAALDALVAELAQAGGAK